MTERGQLTDIGDDALVDLESSADPGDRARREDRHDHHLKRPVLKGDRRGGLAVELRPK